MTLASSLIADAFREGNLIPVGKTPTADQLTEALRRLNTYRLGVFGYEMGEPLLDWLVPVPQRTAAVAANFPQSPGGVVDLTSGEWPYPPKNSRIVFGNVASTVYFPEKPDPGSRMAIAPGSGAGDHGVTGATITLNGNGRFIEGALTKAYTATGSPPAIVPRQWFYREDLSDWRPVVDLALTDDCEFPTDFDDLWICVLMIRLAPRFGKTASKETAECASSVLGRLKARYRQEGVTTYGSQDFPNGQQSFSNGCWRP